MKHIGGRTKAKSGKGKLKLLLVCILPIPHTGFCALKTKISHKG